MKDPNKTHDPSTEEKIKEAARVVFQKTGFTSARSRDIANQAGVNLALVNYYFRSKEKLFNLIMAEATLDFVQVLSLVLNAENTTLEEKVSLLVENYTELLLENPNLPIFILGEIQRSPEEFMQRSGVGEKLKNSMFLNQIIERNGDKEKSLNLFMSLIGMIVFPFIAAPIFQQISGAGKEEFTNLLKQRLSLVPLWFTGMIMS